MVFKGVSLMCFYKGGLNNMNTWTIMAVVLGLIVLAGIALTSAVLTEQPTEKATSTATCGNSGCSVGNTCGLAGCSKATCGQSCGCGKK